MAAAAEGLVAAEEEVVVVVVAAEEVVSPYFPQADLQPHIPPRTYLPSRPHNLLLNHGNPFPVCLCRPLHVHPHLPLPPHTLLYPRLNLKDI